MINYNYSHIEYEKDWYKQSYEKFLYQEVSLDRQGQTHQIIEQCLKYTSSHGRTKIKPLAFESGSGPF